MPTSHYDTINSVMNLISQISPASVLDVGVGFGKMGLLCREYLDIWWARYTPDKWTTRIDGIEIFPQYKNPIYDYCYDNVLFGNVMDHLDMLGDYDLVLLIDVIEHLSKEDGHKLLDTITNNYIVVTPKVFVQNNMKVWENEAERHLSLWDLSEFPESLILGRKVVGWKLKKAEDEVLQQPQKRADKLHFALTSDELIYPYYLSIVSALKTQKVDDVILWCFTKPTGKYWQLLKNRVRLKIVDRPKLLGIIGKDHHFQCAHLKDLIEWQSLYEEGGMFFDLDTFSLKDASDLLDGTCEVVGALEAYDVDDFAGSLHMGIVMAEKGSPIIKEVWDNAINTARQPDMTWNGTGGRFSEVVKAHRDKVKFTDWGMLGGWGDRVVGLYSGDGHVWDKARILHLYAKGMNVDFNKIDEDYISRSNAIFPKLVRQILANEEWRPFMEAKKLAIPEEEQNVHFCSTGPDFPYMYYISVMTALKAYGSDKVILWIAEEPKSGYFELLKDKVVVKKVAADNVPDFSALRDKDDHFRYANIFNYLIWNICYKYGGVLMGLDTITLKPHWDLLEEGKEVFAPVDEKDVLHFAMEGAIIRKGSTIIREVIKDATSVLNGVTMKWGDAGIVPYICHTKLNIEKVTLGAYGQVGRIPDNLLFDDGKLIHSDTRCFSLYERTTKASTKLSEQFVADVNSLYARLVKDILTPEEWNPFGQSNPALTKAIDSWYESQKRAGEKEKEIRSSSHVFDLEELKKHKRFHLLGLPHIPTNKVDGLACAYSMKVLKMAKMLKSMGHTVFFYGVEDSDVECDEFIQVSTRDVLRKAYGDYDSKAVTFRHAYGDFAYNTFNDNAIREINKRKEETDFLLLPWPGDKPIHDAVATNDASDHDKLLLSVEMGIGYAATFTQFRVFESYAWMHHVYGIEVGRRNGNDTDGRNYDVVIPNYFDPEEDFEFCEDKEDYFLQLGRVIMRKGPVIAGEVCEAIGAKLLIAGQDGGEKYAGDGLQLLERLIQSPNVEYVGFADHAKRKQLLKKAKALFVPTLYIGPFEGVAIEAAFSGTPVITTDFGAFAETVLHGVTGYRCRTKDQFMWAAKNIDRIRPADCYKWAMDNFSLDRVRHMYEEYWNMLLDIKCANAWKTEHPERTQLDWLSRTYPQS